MNDIFMYLLVVIQLLSSPATVVPAVLCFTDDAFFLSFHRKISEFPRPIAVKLCHVVGSLPDFII